jgi:hypothetical protein
LRMVVSGDVVPTRQSQAALGISWIIFWGS